MLRPIITSAIELKIEEASPQNHTAAEIRNLQQAIVHGYNEDLSLLLTSNIVGIWKLHRLVWSAEQISFPSKQYKRI